METLGPEDPQRVGAYRLFGRLGAGGMGTVYLGRTEGGRNVAVKLIRAEFAADPEFRRRFQREVAAARRVSGLWTPPVLDADTEGRQPWVATAYVPGPDLAEAVRRFGPLPVSTLRVLGAGLAEGLLAVHHAGLVHRDLKPSNVLLSLDGPRLIDFGIARALDGTATAVTHAGTVIGSPGYMSPEQATGGVAGPPSDVFSLGAVLAAAATGRPPFGEGPTVVAVMYRVLHEQPDLHSMPDGLRDVIEACLDKDPARRPAPQQILAYLLAEADTTASQTGWLPPAISEAVARIATELLHLDAPQAPTPPPVTEPSWPTMPATRFGPSGFTQAPAPQVRTTANRPRRRALAVTALVATGVAAGVVGAVLANSSQSDNSGNAPAANTPSASSMTAPSTSAAAALGAPMNSASSTPPQRAPKTSATTSTASGNVPAGLLGTWQSAAPTNGTTFTLTLRQGRLGGAIGTIQVLNQDPSMGDITCQGPLRLATAGSDRITVVGADFTCTGNQLRTTAPMPQLAITQESAASLSFAPTDGSDTPIELIKQS